MYRLQRVMSLVEKSNNPKACIVLQSSSHLSRWHIHPTSRMWYCGEAEVSVQHMVQAVQKMCRDPHCKLGIRGVEVNFSFPAFNTPFGSML